MDPHLVAALGRCFIGLMFVYSGVDKIRSYAMTLGVMKHFHIPVPALGLPMVIVLEIAGGLLIVANLFVPAVSALLVLFVVVASLLIPLQELKTLTQPMEVHRMRVILAGNVSLVGALLYLFGTTA